MQWVYLAILILVNIVFFFIMKIAGVGLAAHIITQIIILVGFGIFFSLVHKYKTTRFAIPSPQELVGFRKLYNKTDFYALTSRGKKGGMDFSSAFTSSDVHPVQCFDHISAILMYSNRSATFTPAQICMISASWATTMLKGCQVNNYPHINDRYKNDMSRNLCVGASYNGIYRALQHDYKPTDDVQWLIDNPNVEAYVLNTLDYFRHNPALFLRSTDQTLGTLEKLQKYLKQKLHNS